MTLSDDLNATADEIDKRGWCQGVEQDLDGRVCIVGAHNVSYGRNPYILNVEYSEVFIETINDYVGMRTVDWNDADGRTQAEVTQMLRDLAIKHQPDAMEVKHDG